MKGKSVVLVAVIFLLLTSAAVAAEYYRLSSVKRVEQDLYSSSEGLYIETRYCYHYTYGEEAILKWEFKGSINNKVIWADDSSCGVKNIWRRP